MKPAILVPSFLLLFAASAASQQRAVFFEHIGMESGLSYPNITAIHRDQRGFLWIGTDNGGLNRFDGCEMKVYRQRDNDSLSLCSDQVKSIVEDKEGYLWIGTNEGISRFNPANGKCENFTSGNKKLAENFNNLLFKDNQGHIWTSNNNCIERFDSLMRQFLRIPFAEYSKIEGTNRSAFDASGKLWGGGVGGLKLYDPATSTFQQFLPYSDSASLKNAELNMVGVKIDRYNNIWCTSWGGGILRFHPESEQFEKLNASLHNGPQVSFDIAETFDSDGKRQFWIATSGGIFKFPLAADDFPSLSKPYEYFNDKSGVGLENVRLVALLADSEGNLWGGSDSRGLYRYNSRQENFVAIKKVKEGPVIRISFAKNGDLLVCGNGDPLVILDSQFGRKKIFHGFLAKMDPSLSHISWDVKKDEESRIVYSATMDGLIAYNETSNKTRWYAYNPKDSTGLLSRKVTNILPLGKGSLLLAFWGRRLQVFDAVNGKSISTLKVPGLNGMITRNLKKTADGKIWVCAQNHLFTFNPDNNQLTECTPNQDWTYWDVFWDAQGQTWLATSEGLCLFDLPSKQVLKKFGIEAGLTNKSVSRICGDSLGRLWLLTGLGLCYFDPKTRQCHTLNQADGLVFGSVPDQMGQALDGRIWLTVYDNIQFFKPELVKTPPPSRVYITGLKINEKDTLPDVPFEQIPEIRLLPGQNALTFTYTAIDLESFGKTNFLYRLDGLQTGWVKAGKNRVANFVNLPAGVYVFRVRPEDAGEDASWEATLRVIVTDYFWQRAWFKNLMIVLVLGSIFGAAVYYYRSQLRLEQAEAKRREAVEATRSQIAQDIHDDLGTDLSKISMGASVAAMMPNLDQDALRARLHAIGAEAQEVAQHLRDVIFITNPRFDAFSEVQGYYREKGREFLESVGLEPHFDFPKPKHNPSVPPEVKRNLYLLLRECLNNIAKHAHATEVFVSFRLHEGDASTDPSKLTADTPYSLEIRDNGRGFDLENTRHYSNGLKGMTRRAEKIGAKLEINSVVGQGTTILLRGSL
ncbi:MAG: two-component regulator propeller domain-containing protein [Saprospiraceae bacterium]